MNALPEVSTPPSAYRKTASSASRQIYWRRRAGYRPALQNNSPQGVASYLQVSPVKTMTSARRLNLAQAQLNERFALVQLSMRWAADGSGYAVIMDWFFVGDIEPRFSAEIDVIHRHRRYLPS